MYHRAGSCAIVPLLRSFQLGNQVHQVIRREGPRAPLSGLMGIGVAVASTFILYHKGVPLWIPTLTIPHIEAPESTTTPPPQAFSKTQSALGCIVSVVFFSFVVGASIFFGLKCADSDVSKEINDAFSAPTPVPAFIEATPTPAIMPVPTISIESAEKMIAVCQTVASVMLNLNERGFTEEQTILAVANELDMTLKDFTDLMGLCSQYYGNLPVE